MVRIFRQIRNRILPMKIIKEFIAFLKSRDDITLSGILQEDELLTYMVNRYDMEKEILINDLVINKLLKDLINE
jgi:hypothetical protein